MAVHRQRPRLVAPPGVKRRHVRRRNTYPGTVFSTVVDRVEVRTVVNADVDDVFDFVLDFPGYAAYSKHLTDVRQRGDGGPGTAYELTFRWWKLGYTAHSTVTDVDRPHRIDWRITKDIDATGYWQVTALADADSSGDADPGAEATGDTGETPGDAAEAGGDEAAGDTGEPGGEAGGEHPVGMARTEVRLVIEYDASSAQLGSIDLPRFVSVAWVVEKVKPKIRAEATRIVERVVADLEGQPRDVDLDVVTDRSNRDD